MIPAITLAVLMIVQNAPVGPVGPIGSVPPLKPAKPTIVQRGAQNANAPVMIPLGGRDLQASVEAPPLPTDAELARVEVPAELVRLARMFDADSYAERASARDQIVARKPAAGELMALLLRRDLSHEARHALVAVLGDRIVNAPRGALGIRMEGPLMRETGVRVTGLVPGMPAERVLQVGDLVREVDGQQLLDRSDLIRAVQSMPPGLEIQLLVRRTKRDAEGKVLVGDDGLERTEELKLKLRLGTTEDLDQKGDPQGGGVVNAMTLQRQAQVEEARRRFLPPATVVNFPKRELAPQRPSANAESLRKQLVAMQLAGADPELIRTMRQRLDALVAKLATSQDEQSHAELQAELELLSTEIRALR